LQRSAGAFFVGGCNWALGLSVGKLGNVRAETLCAFDKAGMEAILKVVYLAERRCLLCHEGPCGYDDQTRERP
jgi:hypothetical protein